MLCSFGFCVNNRKKNQSGGYDDEPCFLDVTAFGKIAENIVKYLRKGSQAYIEGHLVFEQWNDKTSGQKRSKLKVVADNVQFLDAKGQGGGQAQPQANQSYESSPESDPLPSGAGGADIPF